MSSLRRPSLPVDDYVAGERKFGSPNRRANLNPRLVFDVFSPSTKRAGRVAGTILELSSINISIPLSENDRRVNFGKAEQ
jgi:hypothetical protein